MPYFILYAPDYTDDGAPARRLKVREQHLANSAKESRIKLGGAILSPNECLDIPDAERKMAGSFRIVEAESYAEVKALVESDVYWTGDVSYRYTNKYVPSHLHTPLLPIKPPKLLHSLPEALRNDRPRLDPLRQLPAYPRRRVPPVDQHQRRPVRPVPYRAPCQWTQEGSLAIADVIR
uniref:Polyketide synthase CTB1 ) n=1 Tax=Ganoderma boninense TaxID=34458 RepID=A0A5K1JT11_9APHY|nr:Polyketide synthase CTB1 (EC (Cercosporin toxin biosynthesis cluster protein 1) [Ganoderma boninense]